MNARLFIFAVLLMCFAFKSVARSYIREYHDNGVLKAVGWIENDMKNGYWITFTDTGHKETAGTYLNDRAHHYWHFFEDQKVTKEGYFRQGVQNSWWIFYRINGFKKIEKQFKDGLITGYVLYYKSKLPARVEEYKHNKRLAQWNSYSAFKRDNPDFSLAALNKRMI